ncbi:hypothetical protein [Curvivirga sp.]|uniref:hypothetical protein n=1 Tax=Curvivirga sp. TaxID=2856848 RepID=UPI003B5A3D5D
MTENGFEVIGIAMMSKSHVVLLAMIFSVTPILWMYALWQLFGISKIWQKGEFLTREIGAYFKRFSYVILAIFVVETILHLTVDSLLVSWNYVTAFPEMSLEDILFLVELPFLVACIFLIMGSKAMSEIIVMKEESDLTI